VQEAFVLAEHEGELVGLLGFDADLAEGRAELWGPFAAGEDRMETARRLWEALPLPSEIALLEAFCNLHNTLCAEFALRHGFVEGPRTHILIATRAEGQEVEREVAPLEPSDARAFIALHDVLFPGTYYSGETILGRLNAHRQVFTVRDEEGLCGYAYAEVLPEFGEGSLEFVGVAPRGRGQGFGTRLVRAALAWVFSLGVLEVSLSVRADDAVAGRLYRRAGFRVHHEMRAFRRPR